MFDIEKEVKDLERKFGEKAVAKSLDDLERKVGKKYKGILRDGKLVKIETEIRRSGFDVMGSYSKEAALEKLLRFKCDIGYELGMIHLSIGKYDVDEDCGDVFKASGYLVVREDKSIVGEIYKGGFVEDMMLFGGSLSELERLTERKYDFVRRDGSEVVIDSSKFFGGECIDGRDFSVCEDEIKKRVKEMGGIGLVDVEYKEIEKREYEGRSYFRYRIVGKLIK